MANNERSTTWNIVFYPESAPETWQDIIESSHVPAVCSPCHNLDLFTKLDEDNAKKNLEKLKGDEVYYLREFQRLTGIKAGYKKKEHYHLLVKFDSLKSRQQVIDTFCLPLNANMFPQIAQSERGSVRYLIHMDNPQKPLYRLDEVRLFNGYDYQDFFDLSNAELSKIPMAVQEYIEEENIQSYAQLCEACRVYAPWFNYVINNTYFLTNYIDSRVKGIREPADIITLRQQHLTEKAKELEEKMKQARSSAKVRESEPA